MTKASPGQPLRIQATNWNNIQDATADYLLRRAAGEAGGGNTVLLPSDRIKLKNSSGANRSRGHVLQVDALLYTTYRREHPWFDGIAPNPTADKLFAILKHDAPTSKIEEAYIAGTCFAKVNITNSAHKTATVAASTYVLQSAVNGPVGIVYQPSGTGEKECLVRLPDRWLYKPTIRFTLTAALTTATASQTATLRSQYGPGLDSPSTGAGAITVYNFETASAGTYAWEGDSGAAGLAVWDSGTNYRITFMECP